jgi:L-asparaginase
MPCDRCLRLQFPLWVGIFSLLLIHSLRADQASIPKVRVIGTGGTIASKGKDSLQLSAYSIALSAKEILESVPGLERIAQVEAEQFSNIGSFAMTPELWLKLSWRVTQVLSQDRELSGIVISHGTDTLEETAFFLHLTVRSERPVVLVGAMRPASALSADGPINLLNAVKTATCREARGKGVLVLLNDQISSAREATKQSTYRADAFQPGDFGYLGTVDSDRVVFYRTPVRKHTLRSEFDVEGLSALPRVDIVYSYGGADGVMIDAVVKAGARGIVVAGTGAGDMTYGESEAVLRAREAGVMVVRGTRVGSGRVVDSELPMRDPKVLRPRYREKGIITSDNLTPQKARVLLMLALTRTQNPQEIQRVFDEY